MNDLWKNDRWNLAGTRYLCTQHKVAEGSDWQEWRLRLRRIYWWDKWLGLALWAMLRWGWR